MALDSTVSIAGLFLKIFQCLYLISLKSESAESRLGAKGRADFRQGRTFPSSTDLHTASVITSLTPGASVAMLKVNKTPNLPKICKGWNFQGKIFLPRSSS